MGVGKTNGCFPGGPSRFPGATLHPRDEAKWAQGGWGNGVAAVCATRRRDARQKARTRGLRRDWVRGKWGESLLYTVCPSIRTQVEGQSAGLCTPKQDRARPKTRSFREGAPLLTQSRPAEVCVLQRAELQPIQSRPELVCSTPVCVTPVKHQP